MNKKKKWIPKLGEKCFVSDQSSFVKDDIHVRYYIGMINRMHCFVTDEKLPNILENNHDHCFNVEPWKFLKKFKEPIRTITLDEIASKFNVPVHLIRIKK